MKFSLCLEALTMLFHPRGHQQLTCEPSLALPMIAGNLQKSQMLKAFLALITSRGKMAKHGLEMVCFITRLN